MVGIEPHESGALNRSGWRSWLTGWRIILCRGGLQQADTLADQQAPALQVLQLGVVQRQEQLPLASQVLPKIDYSLLVKF